MDRSLCSLDAQCGTQRTGREARNVTTFLTPDLDHLLPDTTQVFEVDQDLKLAVRPLRLLDLHLRIVDLSNSGGLCGQRNQWSTVICLFQVILTIDQIVSVFEWVIRSKRPEEVCLMGD